MRKRKLPPVRPARARKGNHPSNPYAAEAKTASRLEDRPGYPFPARKTLPDVEPVFELRASDPHSEAVLSFMLNAHMALGLPPEYRNRIQKTITAMNTWRERNRGLTP